jgi:hypothetical protein
MAESDFRILWAGSVPTRITGESAFIPRHGKNTVAPKDFVISVAGPFATRKGGSDTESVILKSRFCARCVARLSGPQVISAGGKGRGRGAIPQSRCWVRHYCAKIALTFSFVPALRDGFKYLIVLSMSL